MREFAFSRHQDGMILIAVFSFILVAGFTDIERTPPLSWDEGWTLAVARNWVELGHYGGLLKGEPVPPILSAHFPVVASVAAGFKLFGVGITQARSVMLAYTMIAVMLLYLLALRLHNRATAIAALVYLLVIPPTWEWHPAIMGRQVIGEMPMLAFLLMGCLSFLHADRHPIWIAVASTAWALALMTKHQALPFWAASMAIPIVLAIRRREWIMVGRLLSGSVGAVIFWQAFRWIKSALIPLQADPMSHAETAGLFEVSALVFSPDVRYATFLFAFERLMPALAGFGYAAWTARSEHRKDARLTHDSIARIMLLTLGTGWFIWYLTLSSGVTRYAFPVFFLSAIPIARLAHDLTNPFDLKNIRGFFSFRRTKQRWELPDLKRIAFFYIAAYTVVLSVFSLPGFIHRQRSGANVREVAELLNRITPPNALIETYESELFLFLDRSYHYPPAQCAVDLMRSGQDGRFELLSYDLLKADPDWVVIGIFGREFLDYAPLVEKGSLRLVAMDDPYAVYERVRF